MTVNKVENVASSAKEYVARKAKAAGKFIADRTSIGRMLTRKEGFGKAYLNAGKQSLEDVSNFIDNQTSIGRMMTKGENFGEAWINAGKETIKEVKDIID